MTVFDQIKLVAKKHDHPLRWRIESNSRPGIEHLVELGAHHGNGQCSCEHFTYRLAPELPDRLRKGLATRCAHIMAARDAFANDVIQRINQADTNDEQ